MDNLPPTQKRTKVACDTCQKGKRKCDGQKPLCTLCKTTNKRCHYSNESYTRKRKYWDEDYVRNLEDQVTALQKVLQERHADTNQLPSKLSGSKCADTNPDTGLHNASEPSNALTFRNLIAPVLQEVSPMTWTVEQHGSNMASFSGPPRIFPRPRGQAFFDQIDYQDPLCDPSLNDSLAKLYFQHFNPIYQVLSKEEFSAIPITDQEEPSDRLLRYSVCAAGACFSEMAGAEILSRTILRHVEGTVLPTCRRDIGLKLLQALIILAWCEMTLDEETMGWTYNCMAGGIVQHLGLHILGLNTHVRTEAQNSCLTSHVRTFWSFFMVDRIAGATMGRQSVIPWKRIETPPFSNVIRIPFADIDEIVFDHQTRLWSLHEQSCDSIYAYNFKELSSREHDKLLINARQAHMEFFSQIDKRLKPSDMSEAEKSVLIFHISYQTALLLVHRPFARQISNSSFVIATRTMTAAATAISRLIRHFRRKHSFADTVPMLIYHIFRAAVTHLVNTTSANADTRQQSVRNLRVCIEALVDGSRRFKLQGSRAIKSLQDLAQKWRVGWVLPTDLTPELQSNTHGCLVHSGTKEQPLHESSLIGNHPYFDPYSEQATTQDGDPSLLMPSLLDQWMVPEIFEDAHVLDPVLWPSQVEDMAFFF